MIIPYAVKIVILVIIDYCFLALAFHYGNNTIGKTFFVAFLLTAILGGLQARTKLLKDRGDQK